MKVILIKKILPTRKSIFPVIILMLFLNSCSLLFPFYGIKDAKDEPMVFEKKYLTSHRIDTSNMFRLKRDWHDSLSIMTYALNTYKLTHGGKASADQIRMYDKDGKFLYGWEQCFGNINYYNLFKTVPISSKRYHNDINRNLNFWSDLKLFDLTSSEKDELTEKINKNSYIIVVYWAAWTGHFAKSTLRKVNSYVKQNEKDKILFIKVNTAPYTSPARNDRVTQ